MGLLDYAMRGGMRQGYGQRGGGGGIRWIIALAIAGFAVVSYLGKRQTNPVTGETQYVDMTVDQEKALGLQAAPQMAQKMGGVVDPRTDPDAQLVAEVGRRLVERSEASKSPYVGNFNFYLLNDAKLVNAFALPGGQIFITRALFNKLENEAQLAGVLGHEIGHVVHRHSAEHMAKGKLGNMLVLATGVGASGERNGTMATVGAMAANQMLQLKHGRDDETESDTYGLRYLAQSGYDPRGMLAVMEVLRQAGGRGQPEFMSSHPLPETRLHEIGQTIAKMFPDGVPPQLTSGRPLRGDPQFAGDRPRRERADWGRGGDWGQTPARGSDSGEGEWGNARPAPAAQPQPPRNSDW